MNLNDPSDESCSNSFSNKTGNVIITSAFSHLPQLRFRCSEHLRYIISAASVCVDQPSHFWISGCISHVRVCVLKLPKSVGGLGLLQYNRGHRGDWWLIGSQERERTHRSVRRQWWRLQMALLWKGWDRGYKPPTGQCMDVTVRR